ncbi:MAG TPA: T9SS type A sorting domain-containing protein [Ignavibacteriaceae bacterium]|nr:T9SS type A sorting domain-containing protein [Ignavibacteriaceae bacterium]
MKIKNLFSTFVFALLLAATTYPATYFVDNARPNDSGSGLSWALAKKTISAAISVSAAGDTILVKYGTYLITSSLSLTSNRMITSDDGSNNSWNTALYDSSQCIIKPDTSIRCRIFTISTSGISNSTHLRGLKITEGEATLETINALYGGGILILSNADPVIENCWVYKNTAATIYDQSYGGGIAITGTGTNPIIQYCTIDSNVAGIIRYGDGGGISSDDVSMPQIHHNIINNNIATTNGSAHGGGIYCSNSYAVISDNIISNNIASNGSYGNAGYGFGGGIYVINGVVQILSNNISFNIASTSRGGTGGGIDINGNGHYVYQNEITDNVGSSGQEGSGGGIACSGDVQIKNNIIANNKACISSGYVGVGGGVSMQGTDAIFEYNIIDNNIASVYGEGRGGGIVFAGHSISYNIISNNLASQMADGYGGGAWSYNAAHCTLGNNTFYHNANKGLGFASGNGSGVYYWYGGYNFKMKNNIFMDHNVSGSDSVAVFSGEILTNNWNNCFYNNGSNYNSNFTSHNDVLANPQLTDPANGIFTLLYNSPCIDAGADTMVYNQTTNHNMGWVMDIGANEYTGSRVLKSINGAGEYYFGGQVRAKINVTTPGSLSEIDITVHPGETHTYASASLQRWYEITSTGSGATFDITLSYKDTELNGEVESDLNLWRWDGSNWNGPGLSSDTSTINNWLTVTGQTSFGDWVISDADDPGALPVEDNPVIAGDYELLQNYPNPFNPSTRIQYQVPSISQVTLKVYDVLGNEVATLVNEEQSAGVYEIEFDASKLSSGVYFYRLQADAFSETKKFTLIK